MTEIKNHISPGHPDRVSVEFNENQQPKLYFDKLCQEAVSIERRTDGGEWQKLAEGVRSPYTDENYPAHTTQLRYRILFGEQEPKSYELAVNLPD